MPTSVSGCQATLATDAFRKALAVMALYPKTWFGLGCAYMLQEQWTDALDAFGRTVALAPEVRVAACAASSLPRHTHRASSSDAALTLA